MMFSTLSTVFFGPNNNNENNDTKVRQLQNLIIPFFVIENGISTTKQCVGLCSTLWMTNIVMITIHFISEDGITSLTVNTIIGNLIVPAGDSSLFRKRFVNLQEIKNMSNLDTRPCLTFRSGCDIFYVLHQHENTHIITIITQTLREKLIGLIFVPVTKVNFYSSWHFRLLLCSRGSDNINII